MPQQKPKPTNGAEQTQDRTKRVQQPEVTTDDVGTKLADAVRDGADGIGMTEFTEPSAAAAHGHSPDKGEGSHDLRGAFNVDEDFIREHFDGGWSRTVTRLSTTCSRTRSRSSSRTRRSSPTWPTTTTLPAGVRSRRRPAGRRSHPLAALLSTQSDSKSLQLGHLFDALFHRTVGGIDTGTDSDTAVVTPWLLIGVCGSHR